VVLVGNSECNTERSFKNQLYIELGVALYGAGHLHLLNREAITGQATVRTFFAKSAENANSPLH
jgi:hypothetical protein